MPFASFASVALPKPYMLTERQCEMAMAMPVIPALGNRPRLEEGDATERVVSAGKAGDNEALEQVAGEWRGQERRREEQPAEQGWLRMCPSVIPRRSHPWY